MNTLFWTRFVSSSALSFLRVLAVGDVCFGNDVLARAIIRCQKSCAPVPEQPNNQREKAVQPQNVRGSQAFGYLKMILTLKEVYQKGAQKIKGRLQAFRMKDSCQCLLVGAPSKIRFCLLYALIAHVPMSNHPYLKVDPILPPTCQKSPDSASLLKPDTGSDTSSDPPQGVATPHGALQALQHNTKTVTDL